MPGVVAVLTLDDLAPVLRQRRMVRVSNSGTQARPELAVRAGRRRGVVRRRAGRHRGRERSLYRRGCHSACRGRLRRAAGGDRLPDVERAPPVRRELTTNQIIAYKVAYGDSDAAFAKAAHVVHEDLWIHRGAAHSMEGRGILVQISDRETQVLGLDAKGARSEKRAGRLHRSRRKPAARRHARCRRRLRPEAVRLSRRRRRRSPRRPCCAARSNGSRTAASISPMRCRSAINIGRSRSRPMPTARCAASAAGCIHDIGAYALQDVNIPYNSATTLSGPYMVPALAMDVVATHTNKTPVSSVRGAGYPQAAFAMERLMDSLARASWHRARRIAPPQSDPGGEDAVSEAAQGALRRAGAIRQRRLSRLPGGDPARRRLGRFSAPPGRSARAWPLHRHRAGARHQGHRPRPVRIRRREDFADRTHHGFDRRRGDGAGARHRACANLRRGSSACARDDVTVVSGDTSAAPLGLGGFASRQTVTAGSSVQIASQAVAAKARKLASHMLEAAEEDLEIVDGEVRVVGAPQLAVKLGELARVLKGAPGYALSAGHRSRARGRSDLPRRSARLFQRLPRRRGRGRYRDRRRHHSALCRDPGFRPPGQSA